VFDARTIAQWAMESPLVVGIYESRLWRRSPILTALLGISFAREQALVLDAAALAGDETVLDLACGSGIYSRPLARRLLRGRVLAVDLSPAMLAYARGRARHEGLGNLVCARADAQALPCADGAFGLVLCSAALHLMPDTARVLAEVHRVLAPGGRVILAVFRMQSGRLAQLTARLRRGVGTHAFTDAGLERHLHEAGFGAVQTLHARAGWLVVLAVRGGA
jgi:ubiquinone/menaquinone biosynthesis C-methylase UbiE